MSTTAKRIFGGAMVGFGDGLVKRAEEKRSKAMKLLEQEHQLKRDKQLMEGRMGLIAGVYPDEDGNMHGVTQGGDTTDLGFTGRKSGTQMREERLAGGQGGGLEDGLTTEENNERKAIMESAEYKDGEGSEVVDTDKYLAGLRASKSQRLNDLADTIEQSIIDTTRPPKDEWESHIQELIDVYRDGPPAETGGQKPRGLAPSLAEEPAAAPEAAGKYATAEEVGLAMQRGEITEAEARRILANDFGGT